MAPSRAGHRPGGGGFMRARRKAMPALLVAAALVAVGCGSDSGGGGETTGGVKVGQGKPGGAVTFLAAGDVDYLDPGQTYYTFGYLVHYAVNRTLYSFKPDDSIHPVADLATGPPKISSDNKTVTISIKRGVRYAPPVNREVKAQDVKYGIERAFTSNVPSGYATSYFSEIQGAPSKPVKISKLKPFSGIETADAHPLALKLTKPVAQRVAAAMVMPITTPVPQEYAAKYDAK